MQHIILYKSPLFISVEVTFGWAGSWDSPGSSCTELMPAPRSAGNSRQDRTNVQHLSSHDAPIKHSPFLRGWGGAGGSHEADANGDRHCFGNWSGSPLTEGFQTPADVRRRLLRPHSVLSEGGVTSRHPHTHTHMPPLSAPQNQNRNKHNTQTHTKLPVLCSWPWQWPL